MKPMIEELIQYKEWHVATQRQLKKRYDQIHSLTVLNRDLENSEKRAYAALKAKTEDYDKLFRKHVRLSDEHDKLFREHDELQQHYKAKTVDFDIRLSTEQERFDNLQEAYTKLQEMFKTINKPVTEDNCGCSVEKKPFKALIAVSSGNTPVTRRTEFILQRLVEQLKCRGAEVHIEIKQLD